ncbi:cytochrome p450 monooxygenase [Galdieria sulphuraria]|uniref:Cytochrome p450 monooxygenase n=1 Tax=Galdieria sulphuraria TaxID=130081 RepID=M2W325_GALSU|nr:cytochrome p450 monooxygenase [Galdieria sulphuraria]EME30101.1 cytochrome p450 monooxygenase [Galdieria sulphuraria]|eukprot:XP_005706621.1 cytochrome p450 monooxygenase [Galdieria sulphuraria]
MWWWWCLPKVSLSSWFVTSSVCQKWFNPSFPKNIGSILLGTLWLVVSFLLLCCILAIVSALRHWLVHSYRWLFTPCYRKIPFAGKPQQLQWWRYLFYGHSSYAAVMASPNEIARWFLQTRTKLHSYLFSYCFMFLAPRIALVSPEAAKHVMVKNVRNYVKPPMVRQGLSNLLGNKGILLAEGDDHARQRRIILPAFHFDALVHLGPIFRAQGQQVVQRWLNRPEEAIDVHLDMTQVTMNVIALAAFGYDPNTDSGQELYRAYRDIFTQRPPSRMLAMLFSLLPSWLLQSMPLSRLLRRQQSNVRLVKKKVTEIVQKRREEYEALLVKDSNAMGKSTTNRDLLDMLVAARDPELEKKSSHLPYLTDEEITSQALTFMAAGQVTTAVLLSWTLFELSIHPSAQEKLRQELQTMETTLSTQDITEMVQHLDKLEYLDVVLHESLRLHPPVLFITRQAVQDDEILGFPISQGAIVNIPIVALHRDPEQWGPDAESFRPERFLSSDKNNVVIQRHAMAWLPFLYGTRACTGQRFAMLEAKTILFELLTKVSVRLQPGCEVKGYGMVSVPRDVRLQVVDLHKE